MARELDAADPLREFRNCFHLPRKPDGEPVIYFCSHSLGLQPKSTRSVVEEELENWATRGVAGHFHGPAPWYTYQEQLREPAARLVGALPHEVIHMNGLTVNLHLLLTSFFRPTPNRYQVLMEEPCFPSDLYAVKSQLRLHGHDPLRDLVLVKPREGELTLRTEDIEAVLDRQGNSISVVHLNLVNFLTGQVLDIEPIVRCAHRHGCLLSLDLAHAAGNIPLRLHDWEIDFAAWCTYKYLVSGPGAIAGCFVHEKQGRDLHVPRLAGWWGNDPTTRFRMQLEPEFTPRQGADGWQVSNPPILALAPVRAALALFERADISSLREKSICLTGYLLFLLDQIGPRNFKIITPRPPSARGCMVSLLVQDRPKDLLQALEAAGIVADFREPNFIRVAPVPLYNTFEEVRLFAEILARHVNRE